MTTNSERLDANTCDKYGNAPLHLAVSRGDMDCINVLLPFTDTTILNGCNRLGQTPLKVAVSNRHINGVRLLLSAGADPDSPSPSSACSHLKYPLGGALWDYDPEMVGVLLQAGARPEHAYDALHSMYKVYEYDRSDPDVIFRPAVVRRLLTVMLRHGLEPAQVVPTCLYGDTLLHAMCRYSAPIKDIGLALQYSNNPPVNIRNADGDTLLLCYVKNSNVLRIGVVRTLLEHGADASICDGMGRSLLSFLERRYSVPDGLREMLVDNSAT